MDQVDKFIKSFSSEKEFEKWLEKNYTRQEGVWIRFYKKRSGVKSINYAEALDVALCYGWIDSHVRKFDENSWIHKFTPRRKRSMWSKRNIEHIDRLTKEGRIKPSGLKEIERAKIDGRWESAYHSPSAMQLPEGFLKELAKDKKAKAFFDTLNKSNRYAIAWRLQTAKKPETKEKRKKEFIMMLKRGEAPHLMKKKEEKKPQKSLKSS